VSTTDLPLRVDAHAVVPLLLKLYILLFDPPNFERSAISN
jgi:hypothetical protein